MVRDSSEFVGTLSGLPIQGLDIFEYVSEIDYFGANFLGRQRIEHEGVVGVRAVGADDVQGRGAWHKGYRLQQDSRPPVNTLPSTRARCLFVDEAAQIGFEGLQAGFQMDQVAGDLG